MQDYADYPADPSAVGPDPVLIIVLVAVIVGLSLCAWLLGRNYEARRHGWDLGRTAEDIHEAIARRAKAAISASSGSLMTYVQELLGEIEDRLGPARALTGGANPLLKALEDAVAGKPEKPAAKPHKADHGHEHGHGAVAETTVLQPALVSSGGDDGKVLTQGYVAHQIKVPAPHGHGHDDHKAKDDTPPPLTMKEQLVRVRLAVEDFHTFWCGSREARIKELIAAQRSLCHTAPVSKAPAHGPGKGHH